MIMAGPRPAVSLRALAAMIILVLVTACAGFGPETGPGSAGEPTVAPTMSPQELAAAKKAAGIGDCPRSDPTVGTVDGGLPDVVLPCLGGGRDVRLAGLRGRPMLINIWAQWCEPCRAEARYLAAAARTLGPKLLVLGVDYSDPRPDYAIEFAAYAGWRYPQVVDLDLDLRAPLQIAGPPQTLLVDARGKIVYRHSGPFTSNTEVLDAVSEHLGVTGGAS